MLQERRYKFQFEMAKMAKVLSVLSNQTEQDAKQKNAVHSAGIDVQVMAGCSSEDTES